MLKQEILENMQHIVDNCMGDSKPACTTACPMNTDAKEYIKLLRENKGEEAIKVIREKLFIPKILGRVCAHPCEKGCRRGEEDNPISIANLKRYIADNFDDPKNWDLNKKSSTGKKIAIVGSGPAGAQAALTLLREGHDVTIFEKLGVPGGMMRVGIPEYRLPREIIDEEYSLLTKLGAKFKFNTEIGKNISLEDLKNNFDSILIAIGKHIGRKDLSLENINGDGIFTAVEFLKEISFTRDFKKAGKNILTVGGGDVAMDCARSALRLKNTENSYVLFLEKDLDSLTASKHEVQSALDEGVNFIPSSGINRIFLDNSNRIYKIEVKKCISIFDENGKFHPSFDEKDLQILNIDTLIFSIGQGIDLNINNGLPFEFDKNSLQSKIDSKVFFAGDCASSCIVVGAMAEGQRAGKSINRFLNKEDIWEGRNIQEEGGYSVTKLHLPTEYLPENWDDNSKILRRKGKELDPKERIKTFFEVESTFTELEAKEEANRCLQCECKLCMKECMMMPEYTSCPKELFKEYLEKGFENMDKNIAYSCNECSQCTIKCPNSFEIRENFMEMRKEYVKANDDLSPLAGHTALDDGQELECSKKYSITVPGKKQTKYVLIPGCTVPASFPEAVDKTYKHMKATLGEDNVGIILQCCAKPTEIIGETKLFEERYSRVQNEIEKIGADVIVTLCPSCYLTYEKYSGKKVISYWDLMKETIGIPQKQKNIGINSDVIFNIHDSCPTRNVTSHHDSIRWILKELGYKIEEMKNIRENTRCCGVGGMLGCINSNLYEKIVNRRVNDATQDHIISYCGSCRASMELGGLDSLHILQLIHGTCYMKKDRALRSPDYGMHNRLKTKKILLEKNKSN
ncbi:NADPH-dependent glutamate synthase beta chain [Cetobacterium ceti]|uniref:NADPH-dependent glutamate synthase beta chain n=1 Tax=Cetobacterium ceti TaxID=180163 RepID=A0A1T4N6W5_9FUSO|nr:FAD-dependent oxidoreductase [Cetobacterium ceti]SJZ74944.1 NADPH-dependent glutamate synthase beta chain [Cetobacterium ceti]